MDLSLGQGVRSVLLDGVLGRKHDERARQPVRHTLDGHLALLHCLEECRLGLGRRTVDLVGEEDVSEDRAGPELELVVLLVVDVRPGDVRRQKVGSELDALESATQTVREGHRHQRLREAGEVLEEDVPVR